MAILMMYWFANDIRQVLWFAIVPACITVILILLGVEDPKGTPSGGYEIKVDEKLRLKNVTTGTPQCDPDGLARREQENTRI